MMKVSLKVTLLLLFLTVATLQQTFPNTFPGQYPPYYPNSPPQPPNLPPIQQPVPSNPTGGVPTHNQPSSPPPQNPNAKRSRGNPTVKANVQPPSRIKSRINEASAKAMLSKQMPNSYSRNNLVDLSSLVNKGSQNRGRLLNHGSIWYSMEFDYPFMNCRQNFYIKFMGPVLIWVEVNGVLMNSLPIFPFPNNHYMNIPPSTAKCGCQRVVFWILSWFHLFSWDFITFPEMCINQCNQSIDKFWNYRTCYCECKNRCCPWPQTVKMINGVCKCFW